MRRANAVACEIFLVTSFIHLFIYFVFACLHRSSTKPPTLPPCMEKPVSDWHLFMELTTAREKFLLAWKSPLNLWLIHHSKAIGFETEAAKAIIWIPFYWVPTYSSLLTFPNSKSRPFFPSQDTVFINQNYYIQASFMVEFFTTLKSICTREQRIFLQCVKSLLAERQARGGWRHELCFTCTHGLD